MSRTLQPEDQISHYRVVGPLGSGGMGEERSVALEVLPPDLVRNEERRRRFVKEAKSASSLNHPNIVTIYDIGHDQVGPIALRARPPDLRSAPLMDMDFAVSCPLVRRSRLISAACPSAHAFAPRFLQTPRHTARRASGGRPFDSAPDVEPDRG